MNVIVQGRRGIFGCRWKSRLDRDFFRIPIFRYQDLPGVMEIGFIFDWDGVVVDSSMQHEESWDRLAAVEALELAEGHFREGFGKRNEWIIPNILGWTDDLAEIRRLSDRKEVFYREILLETGLQPLPAVREFVKGLRSEGRPFAVGSSTPRENIEAVMEAIDMVGVFDKIVASADVSKGKPEPEVFLKAASLIGISPERCVVFEDSFGGIQAGLAAGMKVVALATTNTRSALEGSGVHLIADSFADFDLPKLEGLFG